MALRIIRIKNRACIRLLVIPNFFVPLRCGFKIRIRFSEYKFIAIFINMQLFYSPNITLPSHTLGEQESAHCVKVLRMGEGDTVHLTDGRGNLFQAVIRTAHPRHCVVEIVDAKQEFERRNYSLWVAVAPTKNADRLEWFVEKATEIGIDRIIPVVCDRSQRRTVNMERIERVAVSAMKQSLKAYMPKLEEPVSLRDAMKMPFDGIKLIAHCERDRQRCFIGDAVGKGSDVFILIGPEGDFSDEEITFARENGFEEISLGRQRLRTETAALVAVSAVAFLNQ